jgi:hypothetical protein
MNSRTMHRIAAEHRCLLTLAETIGARLEREPEPDYSELHALACALRRQFIEVHLPKERLIVDRLLADTGAARALLATFMNDHGLAFVDTLESFVTGLESLLVDQIVDRKQLHDSGCQALGHLRAQIAAEESSTLPWAGKSLGSRDWRAIEDGAHALPRKCDLLATIEA